MAGEPENQRITRLTPLADVLASIKTAAPVAPRAVDLSGALNRALAEDVAAAAGQPAEARALRDGYAVRAEDIADAGSYAPVPLAAAPVRVDVGDALPPGTDAVVPLDAIVEPRRALRGDCAGRRRRRRASARRRSSGRRFHRPRRMAAQRFQSRDAGHGRQDAGAGARAAHPPGEGARRRRRRARCGRRSPGACAGRARLRGAAQRRRSRCGACRQRGRRRHRHRRHRQRPQRRERARRSPSTAAWWRMASRSRRARPRHSA